MLTQFNTLYNLYIESIENNSELYLNNIRYIISKPNQELSMDEKILEKINNLSKFLLPNNKNMLNIITIKLMDLLKINKKCAEYITSLLHVNYTFDFLNEFLDYLKNKKINLKEAEKISFIDYFIKSKNQQQWHKLFQDLYKVKYDNNCGNGQILFAILFNNCTKSNNGGDISYNITPNDNNSKKIEIKSNRGIIANNYKGDWYGNNADMAPYLINRLKAYIKNSNDSINILEQYINDYTKLNFSKISLKNNSCALIDLFNKIKKINANLSLKAVKNILFKTLQKVYKKAIQKDMQFLESINIDKNTNEFIIDGEFFMIKFIQFTIIYYMNVQQFDYLTFMDAQHAIIFSNSYFQQNNFDTFLNYISIEEFLSFSKDTKRKIAMSMRVNLYK